MLHLFTNLFLFVGKNLTRCDVILIIIFSWKQNRELDMTKVSPEFGGEVEMQAIQSVSADVSFASNQFPKYKLGPDNQILEEIEENNKGPPLKEVVLQETTQLTEQHNRLSVRDLASKFDKNLSAAAKLSEEVSNSSLDNNSF